MSVSKRCCRARSGIVLLLLLLLVRRAGVVRHRTGVQRARRRMSVGKAGDSGRLRERIARRGGGMMRVRVLLLKVRRCVEPGRARLMMMVMHVRGRSCRRTRRRRDLTRHAAAAGVRRHRLSEPLLQLRLHLCAELNPMTRA